MKWLRVLVVALVASAAALRGQAPAQASFADLVARLSEPGGDFGGDNLISNEQSYLHVVPALEAARQSGGVYLGVGPDQNFSYIAAVKPSIAFIIDIRRDNLLLQLLFRSLFALAPTRVEYLGLLTGRPAPDRLETWRDATIDRIAAYLDQTPALPDAGQRALWTRLETSMKSWGVPLSPQDLATIHAFHSTFVSEGLSLSFQVRGQGPRNYYPYFRDLLLARDPSGRQSCYLAVESAYQFMRTLEGRGLVVPVVGDVSGPKAMRAIAADAALRGAPLSAFYISNVEQYLFRDGSFGRFVENLKAFQVADRGVMIRSVFPSGFNGRLPQSEPNSYSTSLTQPLAAMLADLAAGRYQSYYDLILASARSASAGASARQVE